MPPKKERCENQHIQVVVRCRPLNASERSKGCAAVECTSDRVIVRERSAPTAATKTFTFDRVFGMLSKQVELYRAIVKPVVEEVLEGYNCTVFAYGQTGTGKTFTMIGERSDPLKYSWENDPLAGVIPRSLSHLFDRLETNGCEFSVRVSFMELYNEELFDLLSAGDDTTRLRIFDDANRKGSVVVQGLEEVVVSNKDTVYEIINRGMQKRATASTLLNAQSSRSHSVFTVTVHMRENSVDGEELVKIGKLNLVDLAGSENIGRSGAQEKRAREAGSINQSLLTLGRVITALVERAPHIPYRESKLTRILQDSLGGRTKTSIIATITPGSVSLEETLSTLDYAHRAKNIQNRPEVNQKLCKKALLKEYSDEVERLRRDLQAARDKNGFFMDFGNYTTLQTTLQQQRDRIQEQETALTALRQELERLSEVLQLTEEEMEALKETNRKLDEDLTATRRLAQIVRERLILTEVARREEQTLKEAHQSTEERLADQASSLMEAVTESVTDVGALHEKVWRMRETEEKCQERARKLADDVDSRCGGMTAEMDAMTEDLGSRMDGLRGGLTSHAAALATWSSDLRGGVDRQAAAWREEVAAVRCLAAEQAEKAEQRLAAVRRDVDSMRSAGQERLSDLQAAVDGAVSDGLGSAGQRLLAKLTSVQEEVESLEKEAAAAVQTERSQQESALGDLAGLLSSLSAAHERSMTALQTEMGAVLREQEEAQQRMEQLLLEMRTRQAEVRHRLVSQVAAAQESMRTEMSAVRATLQRLTSVSGEGLDRLGAQSRHAAASTRAGLSQAQDSCSNLVLSALPDAAQALSQKRAESARRLDEDCDALATAVVAADSEARTEATELRAAMEARLGPAAETCAREVAARCDRLDEDSSVREMTQQVTALRQAAEAAVRRRQQELGEMKDEVVDVVTHHLPPCATTGKTPTRREYSYPRHLSRTSPHEVLLDQFRAGMDRDEVEASCRVEEGPSEAKKRRLSSGIESGSTKSSAHHDSPSGENVTRNDHVTESVNVSKTGNISKATKRPLQDQN